METAEQKTENIIKTKYWELPESSLDGWRPYTAYLDYRLFEGPEMGTHDKGLNLYKDLMGGVHGARGSCKSITVSYFTAKKMRAGKPAWTNYPISFYVIEPSGAITYYESMPLDFGAFYKFSPDIRHGVVAITELQYYAESRTSGRLQNRIASYQIMQLRKTANSFYYDVQDPGWVDKRFGWSDDFKIECADAAKMSYETDSISELPPEAKEKDEVLREGAISLWTLRDMSGVLTGVPWRKSGIEYDNIQFDAWHFWDIFPTHFIIDAYEAMHSLKTPQDDKKAQEQKYIKLLEAAINELLNENVYEAEAGELAQKVKNMAGIDISTIKVGGIMKACGVGKHQRTDGSRVYEISSLLEGSKE